MKKLLSITISLFFIFSLCNCNKESSDVTAVTTGLSFTAELSYKNQTFKYDYKIFKDGSAEALLHLDKTETKIFFSENSIKYDFNNLEYTQSLNNLNENLIIDFIFSVMKDASNKKVYTQNEYLCLEGKTDKYDYKMYLSEMGIPLKIEDKQKGIQVIITNQALLE